MRVGSHNIHGGLVKAKGAIGAALRNLDILALQEADVAANISFKSHHSFPPVRQKDGPVFPVDDTGDWSEWDEESCSDDEPAAKRARGASANGEWLFIRSKAKIKVLEQHALLIEGRVRGQIYTLQSAKFEGKLLLMNLHLPTGIDAMAADDMGLKAITDSLRTALVNIAAFEHAIILGDLNETISLELDRSNSDARGGHGCVAAVLRSFFFNDAYRACHESGGHTRCDPVSGHTSRLDQCWVRGPRLLVVDATVHADHGICSDHDRLSVTLNVPGVRYVAHSAARSHDIPLALFADKRELKAEFATEVNVRLDDSQLLSRVRGSDHSERNIAWKELCALLTSIALEVAEGSLPTVVSRNDEINVLNQAISVFTDLPEHVEVLSNIGTHQYSRDHAKIIRALPPRLAPPIHLSVGGQAWAEWMGALVAARNVMRPNYARKTMTEKQLFNCLKGSPAKQIDSVYDPETKLVTFDPARVKEVMQYNLKDLVGSSPVSHGNRPLYVDETMEAGKKLAGEKYFRDALDCTPSKIRTEVVTALRSVKDIIGVGTDGVPDSLFKWAILYTQKPVLLDILVDVVTQNFQGFRYESAKEGSLKMIPKPNRAGSAGGRGITKGNLPGKLPSAILASRLNKIITQHALLAPATEHAYLEGREAHDAIREWLQTWRLAMDFHLPCFNIFYDFVKAFDKISWNMILDGVVSIGGSEDLVRYVRSFLAGNRTTIETSYGKTGVVELLRGIKQGDPLSAILFIIAMNVIHKSVGIAALDPSSGLEPFCLHGSRCNTSGFSDDIRLVQGSLKAVLAANGLINSICEYYGVEMNPEKVLAIGRERYLDGWSNWAGSIPISYLDGRTYKKIHVKVKAPQTFIVYLGIPTNMDLKTLVPRKIENMINLFGHQITQNHIPTRMACKACNSVLVSKLDYLCPYQRFAPQRLDRWDSIVVSTIRATIPDNGVPASAAIVAVGRLKVPSEAILISRTVKLHRILIADSPEGKAARGECGLSRGRRWFGAELNIAKRCGVSFGHNGLFGSFDDVSCELPKRRFLCGGKASLLNTKRFSMWGATQGKGHMRMWTDGSVKTDLDGTVTAAWAVVFGTDRFYDNWEHFSKCQNVLQKLGALSTFDYVSNIVSAPDPLQWPDGSHINVDSSYLPELLAILIALLILPVTWDLDLVTDSESAIKAIAHATRAVRALVRSAFHPFLWLILTVLRIREQHDARTDFHHQRSHTDEDTMDATGNDIADVVAFNTRSRGKHTKFETINSDYGDQRVTVTLDGSRVTSDLRSALWKSFARRNLQKWAGSSHWPFSASSPLVEGENRVIGHLQKDMYVADNPYILPLITGTLGDTGYVGAVQQGTCRMCTLPMSGAHVMKCAVYRLLHSFEVNRLFRCALHEVHFVPNKRPPKSEWQELLVQHALDTRAIMADNLGKKYYVQMLDGSWAGYISHVVLDSLVLRYASAHALIKRPNSVTATTRALKSFGRKFIDCLFELLYNYECRGSVSRHGRRCQGPNGVDVPHKNGCNTRFWWRPGQSIIDIAVDILGATIDLSTNAIGINWKFVTYAAVGRYQQCEMSFGSMPNGPAAPGSCFFAFVSKRHGEPPGIPAIQFYLNRACFEAHARIVLFLAVNTTVLEFLHSIPELAVVASFPIHTVHLECPAVWRYGKSTKASKYPFVLCVWQSRGFCKLREPDKKLTERALLPVGIRRVSRMAQFHCDDLDRIWMNLKDRVPFVEPENRAQSLFLLSTVEEEQLRAIGIRGKALSRLLKTMRHGLIDYHVEKWLPCCPKEILRIRNLNTRKRSAPKGQSEMGEDAF